MGREHRDGSCSPLCSHFPGLCNTGADFQKKIPAFLLLMWINNNRNHSPQSCSLRNQQAGWLKQPNRSKLLFKIKTIRKSFGQAIVSRFGETFPLSEMTVSPATNLPCMSRVLSAQESVQPPDHKAPRQLSSIQTLSTGSTGLPSSSSSGPPLGRAVSCSASDGQCLRGACPVADSWLWHLVRSMGPTT